MVIEQTRSVSATLDRIRTRGFWHTVIHPSTFEEVRIPYDALLPTVEQCAVHLRGWPFPSVTASSKTVRGTEWVGQETDWNRYVAYWRLYQSGQFVGYEGIRSDWQDQSNWSPPHSGWQPGQHVWVEDIVLTTTEVFVFAARLASTDAYRRSTHVHVALTLHGLQDRLLTTSPERELHHAYQAQIPLYALSRFPLREELVADARPLAVDAAKEILSRFGFDALPEVLRSLQEQYLR